MRFGEYEAKITREERNKLIIDVKKEVYEELYDIFKEKDIGEVRKTLRSEIKAMKEADVAVIHTVGDDQVRCTAEKDTIVCSVKEGKDWKPLNKHEITRLHVMQYIDREGNCYGLDCKTMGSTIDCNFVLKDRLEKKEKPFIPGGYGLKWTGPPGFQRVRCEVDDGILKCKGSVETVWGMQDEVVDVKQSDHYDKKQEKWVVGGTIREARPIPVVKGEMPFDEEGKMLSLTTEGEKDLNGITFVELSEHGKKKGGRLIAFVMKGKPFKDSEPESKKWVSDDDAGLIGQGYGKNRRKSNYGDIEYIA